jgi:hypothetical protein
MKLKDFINHHYPFTFAGSLLFFFGIYLLIHAFMDNNPYNFLLSISSLAVLGLLTLFGRLQVQRMETVHVEWDTSRHLYARDREVRMFFLINDMKPLPLFRVHFLLKGKMQIGRKANFYFNQEFTASDTKQIPIHSYFPFCGNFKAKGYLVLKDVFYLTRTRFKQLHSRTLTVRPAILTKAHSVVPKALDGFENESKQKVANEERYYQREYLPGDRFRDINWKASSRIAQLFTRISHITQEKSKVLFVVLSHQNSSIRDTAASLAHLNFLKTSLLCFLSSIKKNYPSYQFDILTGGGIIHLESDQDIEIFTQSLSLLNYQRAPLALAYNKKPTEVFLFTTPFDKQAGRIISAFADVKVNIFTTTMLKENDKMEDYYHFNIFGSVFNSPFPGLWILIKDKISPFSPARSLNGGAFNEERLKISLL